MHKEQNRNINLYKILLSVKKEQHVAKVCFACQKLNIVVSSGLLSVTK